METIKREYPGYVIIERVYCPKYHTELTAGDITLLTDPVQYPHSCECGYTTHLPCRYPTAIIKQGEQ